MRVVSVAAVALVLAASTTAVATPPPRPAPRPAPTPSCGVVDDSGDEAGHLGSNALDILSAEAATGRTELVVVLRVPTTETSSDTVRKVGGYEWLVRFGADGIDYAFGYGVASALGNDRHYSGVSVGTETPPYRVEVRPQEILWRVQRSDLPAASRTRSAWVEVEASTHSVEGTADTATGRVRRARCRF